MTPQERELMELALDALERVNTVDDDCDILAPSLADAVVNAIDDIKEALAQPEQEPVACANGCKGFFKCTPPQRKPLTDEQIAEMWLEILGSTPPSGIHEDGLQPWRFARTIEAAHGIKE